MTNCLSFRITKQNSSHERLGISGSCPLFGAWNPQHAFLLQRIEPDTWGHTQPFVIETGKKLEFKIISLNADRVIEWEAMPDNLNRKFRVVEDVLLDITWGDSKGRKKLSSTRSQASTPRELSPDLERVLKYKPKKSKREGNFNPFDDAYNSESDSETKENKLIPSIEAKKRNFSLKEFEWLLYTNSRSASVSCATSQEVTYLFSLAHPFSESSDFTSLVVSGLTGDQKMVWVCPWSQCETQLTRMDNFHILMLDSKRADSNLEDILRSFQQEINKVVTSSDVCVVLSNELVNLQFPTPVRGAFLPTFCPDILRKDHRNFNLVAFQSSEDNQTLAQNLMIDESSQRESRYSHLLHSLEYSQNYFTTFYEAILRKEAGQEPTRDLLKEIDVEEEHNTFTDAAHSLCVFDYNSIVQHWHGQIVSIDPEALRKLAQLSKRKDCLVIVSSDKSKEFIFTKTPELESLELVIIAQSGKEVRLNKEWINAKEKLLLTVEKARKYIHNHILKAAGELLQQPNKLRYKRAPNPMPDNLLQGLKNLLSDKYMIQLTSTLEEVVVSWEFNCDVVIRSLVQLEYMYLGSFDTVRIFNASENKGVVIREIERIIQSHPFYFNRNLKKEYSTRKIQHVRANRLNRWGSMNVESSELLV